jgi:hypothetical protein
MHNVDPTVLLKRMGLTDDELTKMETGFHAFVKNLDHDQKQSLIASIPTAKEAAATLGPDVTPEFLEAFIRAHAPRDASVVLINNGHGVKK